MMTYNVARHDVQRMTFSNRTDDFLERDSDLEVDVQLNCLWLKPRGVMTCSKTSA